MTTTKTTAKLTDNQAKLLIKVLAELLGAGDSDYELSLYHLETRKCGTPRQLSQLVEKGELVERWGKMIMPVGPYAGQEHDMRFFSVA